VIMPAMIRAAMKNGVPGRMRIRVSQRLMIIERRCLYFLRLLLLHLADTRPRT
jgi:hypothetical protein